MVLVKTMVMFRLMKYYHVIQVAAKILYVSMDKIKQFEYLDVLSMDLLTRDIYSLCLSHCPW